MLPYVLDSILSRRRKHGLICPKCGHGMDYQPMGSSSFYACRNCLGSCPSSGRDC